MLNGHVMIVGYSRIFFEARMDFLSRAILSRATARPCPCPCPRPPERKSILAKKIDARITLSYVSPREVT